MQQDSAEERETYPNKKFFFDYTSPSSRSILGSDAQKSSNVCVESREMFLDYLLSAREVSVRDSFSLRSRFPLWLTFSKNTANRHYSSLRLEIWWQLHQRGKIILFGNENRVTPLVRDLPILLSRRDVWWLTPSPRDVLRPLFWPVAFADIHEQQRRVSQELGKESTRNC